MFSIIIPTWNNFAYVKLCIESIQKNATLPFEIILHINEGSDGTLEWAKEQQLVFTHTENNIGICFAVNMAAALAKGEYIVYMNDDMYCCPGWDSSLAAEIKQIGHDKFMLSGTMIEPTDTGNGAVVFADFGKTAETFQESALLKAMPILQKNDWSGSSWPPIVISKNYWQIIGGFSIEFSPGMASDDDLSMKMWQAGCRIFKGVGKSKVYHFQTKSTARVQKNDGRKQFVLKWNMTSSTFNRYFLHKGEPYSGALSVPSLSVLKKDKLKIWFKKKFVY